MATYDQMAMYESVIRHEQDNPTFTNEKEISEVIESLVSKGILEDKVGIVKDIEIEYLLKFGDIKSKDKRVLAFILRGLNEKIEDIRIKLYDEIFCPK